MSKVGLYRKWIEPIPVDRTGQPIPREQWPRKRRHNWIIRWKSLDGHHHQETYDTKAEAEKAAAAKTEEIEADPMRRNKPRKLSLKEYRNEFAKLRIGPKGRKLQPTSVAVYVEAMDKFIKHAGEQRALASITRADVTRFVAALRDTKPERSKAKKMSPATVNRTIRSLKVVFAVALRQLGYLKSNPLDLVSCDRESETAVQYLSPAEFEALLDTATELWRPSMALWWKALIAVCYTAGLRKGEAANLTWADVDFELNRLRVIAKSESDGILPWTPKGKKSRTIPIPNRTAKLLAELQAKAPEGHAYVFLTPDRLASIQAAMEAGEWSGLRDVLNRTRKPWERLLTEIGIEGVTIHDLRRSAITNWARKLSIHITQEFAGHSSITTTRKYYLKVTEDDYEAGRRAASEIFDASPEQNCARVARDANKGQK